MLEELVATEFDTTLNLEEQLQSAVKLVTQYKEENANLTRALEDSKQFSRANVERNAEMRECWKRELEVVKKQETELEREESNWKRRLQDRKLELEVIERKYNTLSEKVTSNDSADALKQCKIDYSSKISSLENEAKKWRESYYEALEASEQFKLKCHESTGRIQREKEANESLKMAIQSFQETFLHHIESRNENQSDDLEKLVKDMKREINEKDISLSSLQEQIKVVERERDEAIAKKDSLIVSHQTEIAGLNQDRMKLDSKISALERRLLSNEKTLSDAERCKTLLDEKLNHANKDLARLQTCLQTTEETHMLEIKKLQHDMGQSLADTNKRLSQFKLLLAEEQEKSKKLDLRCSELHDDAMKHINELALSLEKHDDCSDELLVAKDEIYRLENTLTNIQDEKLQISRDHDAECHRLHHAIESCHHEIRMKTIESNQAAKEYDIEKERAGQFQKDWIQSESSRRKYEQKCQLLDEEKRKLVALTKDLNQNKALLESELKDMKQNLTQTRAEADELSHQLNKEKKRSGAYKDKALEAHRRSVEAKAVLDSIYKTD